MASSSKRQITMAKRDREQAVREKRARKQRKKEERRLAAAAPETVVEGDAEVGAGTGDAVEEQPSPELDGPPVL